MRWRALALIVIVGVTAIALQIHFASVGEAPGRHPEFPTAPERASTQEPAPVRVETEGEGATAVGALLARRDDVANDAVFLVVASVLGRCHPDHRHELPAMAATARLPVLSAATEALRSAGVQRARLLDVVRDVSAKAPCRGPFVMVVGGFARHVDPERYAATFPDSYFDPDLVEASQEFAGMPLATRAADECIRAAYQVLPLDSPRAWQCAGLRAQGRERIRSICHRQTDPAEAARDIRETVDRIPSTCQ